MFDCLILQNFPASYQINDADHSNSFVLVTCQRTLILSFQERSSRGGKTYYGVEAYELALQVLCGLKSQIIGEHEIVDQFKQSLALYLKSKDANGHLVKILEKILHDAKKIRTTFLVGLCQKTYAGIVRKSLDAKQEGPVLIIGSGALAIDIINQLKKNFTIHITARNRDKLNKICLAHGIHSVPWDEKSEIYRYQRIVNTVGVPNFTLFEESFFKKWRFIGGQQFFDLGGPSSISSSFGVEEGLLRLTDIFKMAQGISEHKGQQLENAFQMIQELAKGRHKNSVISQPFGWEELGYAENI